MATDKETLERAASMLLHDGPLADGSCRIVAARLLEMASNCEAGPDFELAWRSVYPSGQLSMLSPGAQVRTLNRRQLEMFGRNLYEQGCESLRMKNFELEVENELLKDRIVELRDES